MWIKIPGENGHYGLKDHHYSKNCMHALIYMLYMYIETTDCNSDCSAGTNVLTSTGPSCHKSQQDYHLEVDPGIQT